MRSGIRSHTLLILIASVLWGLWLPTQTVLRRTSNHLAATPTIPHTLPITADNVSRLRLEKTIGRIERITGPYRPQGGTDLLFSPQGTYLASDYNTDGTLRIWSVQTGQLIASLSGHSIRVEQAVFTADERFVATTDYEGTFRIWSMSTHQSKIVNIDAGGFWVQHSVAASPDGRMFAVGGKGTQVVLVDAASGNVMQILGKNLSSEGFHTEKVQFNPTGDSLLGLSRIHMPLAAGTNAVFTLWNLNTGQSTDLTGDNCTVRFAASFGLEGTLFVASFSKSQNEVCNAYNFVDAPIVSIQLWDLSSRRKIASLPLKNDDFNNGMQVGFRPDGEIMVVETPSKISFWRLTPEKEPGPIISIHDSEWRAFTHDGLLAITTRNLWHMRSGNPLNLWMNSEDVHSPESAIFFVDTALSPDGTTIGILMENSTIQLWGIQ